MGAVETVLDVATDNRTYYHCPKCGKEVWAYGSYVGNTCWNCPGTLTNAVTHTTDLATFGLTSTITDAIQDKKIEYRCPRCGVKKWAYGVGVGRPCLNCINKNALDNPLGEKDWFDMANASEREVSLNTFCKSYYNSNGKIAEINNETFTNVIHRDSLYKALNYEKIHTNWCCGNNAINICLKMHGYNKQLSSDEYEYNTVLKCGWSYSNFYDKNIKPTFKYCSWKGSESVAKDISTNWDFIDNNNYDSRSIIIMGGRGVCAHYTIIIGVSENKKYYLIMDQQLKVWLIDQSLLRKISVYEATRGMAVNLYKQHSLYKVG